MNRLFVLPFIHELSDEEIDMRIPEKLEAEKDAIVTKLLRLMRETLMPDGSIKLYESPASKALKFKWTMQNNDFEDFFRQMVELTGDDLVSCFYCYAGNRNEGGRTHRAAVV